MAKHGTKGRIGSPYETQDNPNYGGRVKPPPASIKKMTSKQAPTQLQADNARMDRKFGTRGAADPWKPPGKKATSKGGCDVSGDKPSKRVGHGPGYDDSKGYSKR